MVFVACKFVIVLNYGRSAYKYVENYVCNAALFIDLGPADALGEAEGR